MAWPRKSGLNKSQHGAKLIPQVPELLRRGSTPPLSPLALLLEDVICRDCYLKQPLCNCKNRLEGAPREGWQINP